MIGKEGLGSFDCLTRRALRIALLRGSQRNFRLLVKCFEGSLVLLFICTCFKLFVLVM